MQKENYATKVILSINKVVYNSLLIPVVKLSPVDTTNSNSKGSVYYASKVLAVCADI